MSIKRESVLDQNDIKQIVSNMVDSMISNKESLTVENVLENLEYDHGEIVDREIVVSAIKQIR